MEIRVVSREDAEKMRVGAPHEKWNIPPGSICISIRNVGWAPARLFVGPRGFADVLHLEFDDCDDPRNGIPMNKEHANEIITFFQKHRNTTPLLVIHCHAGISRSPGVAIGLCDCFHASMASAFMTRFPYYNRLVRSLLFEVKHGPEPKPRGKNA